MLGLLSPRFALLFFTTLAAAAHGFEISKVDRPAALIPLEVRTGGRTLPQPGDGGAIRHRFQWPGVYFRAAFSGTEVYFETGAGRAIYHVRLDDAPDFSPVTWMTTGPGVFRIGGLPPQAHQIRIELATECQGGPVEFGGFFVGTAAQALPPPPELKRRIEFIGDSHTVGYGNTSTKRQCAPDEVWSSTDTSQAFGPLVARHFAAEYRVNAISGRGIIRNYGGFAGDPLPAVYPFILFDKQHRAQDLDWHPDVIVIGLGTNDFSTPLKPGERWATRADEHADFERSYVAFVRALRLQHRNAFFLLAANDAAEGEIQTEVRKVIDQLAATGEKRAAFVAFDHLELTGCDWHPSLADHQAMAAVVNQFLESHPDAWQAPHPAKL